MSGNNYRMLTIVLYEAQIILGSSNCLQTPNLSADISVYPRDFKRSAGSPPQELEGGARSALIF